MHRVSHARGWLRQPPYTTVSPIYPPSLHIHKQRPPTLHHWIHPSIYTNKDHLLSTTGSTHPSLHIHKQRPPILHHWILPHSTTGSIPPSLHIHKDHLPSTTGSFPSPPISTVLTFHIPSSNLFFSFFSSSTFFSLSLKKDKLMYKRLSLQLSYIRTFFSLDIRVQLFRSEWPMWCMMFLFVLILIILSFIFFINCWNIWTAIEMDRHLGFQ